MTDNKEHGILVVDDEEPIVKSLRRLLKRKGFTKVISVLNGEQGIKLLETEQSPFFLIISDQNMPGMSGSEFLEKSIALSPESRRILITGHIDFNSIAEAINRGKIHRFILKPWKNEDFLLKIMEDLEIYKKHIERKNLNRIVKRQNVKLFEFASTQKDEINKVINLLKNKEKEAKKLEQKIRKAKGGAEFKEVFLGLDTFLSMTIPMNANNLSIAYTIIKDNAEQILQSIADRNDFLFSPDSLRKSNNGAPDLEDDIFEVIDKIIETAAIQAEDDLFEISDGQSDGDTIDTYEQVPQFDELAFNDGFITIDEREAALEELKKKESRNAGLTIDKILIRKGYLKRQELSPIFLKLNMIQTRILDRRFGDLLLKKELTSQKDIKRAFRKQWNSFKETGTTISIGDLLVASEVITPEIRDEIMIGQNREANSNRALEADLETTLDYSRLIDLKISEDRIAAWISVPQSLQGTTDIEPVKQLIKRHGIVYGILVDDEIRQFFSNLTDETTKLKIAQGVAPTAGRPAEIVCHFNQAARMAGTINKDGTIDFRDRGEVPHAIKEDLLAEKKPMEEPQTGMSIFGEIITVNEIHDIKLQGGTGVQPSEDGLKLYAVKSGYPSIDGKGVISILDSFTVQGDVDFKTGNINFDGHVVVTGIIKEGFEVTCDDLTVNEIHGGIVRSRGNLKVSQGIVDSDIQTEGSVKAKFLNKTKLYAYGDMMITREIMESQIVISGALNNATGRITGSTIAARKGIKSKQIGTGTAKSSNFRIGTNDHIQWLCALYDLKIEKIQNTIEPAVTQKGQLDEGYNAFHAAIAEHTFTQEEKTKKIHSLENSLVKTKDKDKKTKFLNEIKELKISVHQNEERMKAIFNKQDLIHDKANELGKTIERLTQERKTLQEEKKKIVSMLETDSPVPEITITKKAFAGTKITGTEGSMILKEDYGSSKFYEIDPKDPNHPKQIVHQTLTVLFNDD